jgi:hypothetical protein
VEQAYESAKLAGLSILESLKREMVNLDNSVASTKVMVNTGPRFIQAANVADGLI